MANCQVIKQNNQDSRCNTIRIALLVWAFLRLAVSMLWTTFLILITVGLFPSPNSVYKLDYFEHFAVFIQIIELEMLVTFIVAGFKKSASVYLFYYWYCIVTLIIYVIMVTLCLSLPNVYFKMVYIFYFIFGVIVDIENDQLAFLITSIFDFGLEILLIYLIKKLINNYRYYGNEYVAGEAV